jgi:hypothetical protein
LAHVKDQEWGVKPPGGETMTEFAKEKIAFAIGLLAVIFTLTPLLESYGSAGFLLVGLRIEIRQLYLFLSASLGLAVYFYGLQFMTGRRMRFAAVTGDVFYALAMVGPLLFASLFLAVLLASAAARIFATVSILPVIEGIVSSIAGAGAMWAWFQLRATLDRKQKHSEAFSREQQEISQLRRAEDLLRAGHSDLAIVEAFRSLELAAPTLIPKLSSLDLKKKNREWFQILTERLPTELRAQLEMVRNARNLAAHGLEPITSAAAQEAVRTIGRVLAVLSANRADRCPQCGSTDVAQESGSDSGYSWQRARCLRCGWVDV